MSQKTSVFNQIKLANTIADIHTNTHAHKHAYSQTIKHTDKTNTYIKHTNMHSLQLQIHKLHMLTHTVDHSHKKHKYTDIIVWLPAAIHLYY